MRHDDDQKIYRTFEEFEREEIRRADAVGGTVDGLFDDLFTEEVDFESPRGRRAVSDYGDDEE